jgi:hypothetical protein
MTVPTSVWLYGSYARGDPDLMSDKDLLVVCDEGNSLQDLSLQLPAYNLRDGQVSQYSWSEIREMASYGSLFLEHLKLEGVVIYESPECQGLLRNILTGLPPYRHAHRDIQAFLTVITDVREELLAGSPPSYELGVLGTVIRHASILGCHLMGPPCFSRTEPVTRMSQACGLPPEFNRAFPELYRYRLIHEGRPCDPPAYNPNTEQQWLDWAEYLVHFVEALCHERTTHLPATSTED